MNISEVFQTHLIFFKCKYVAVKESAMLHRCLPLVLMLFCLSLMPDTAHALQERRQALVIGNADYVSSPLRNPVNDAQDMSRALRNLGFDVTLLTNVSQRQMEEGINAFGQKLRDSTVALFYYAGHGIQIDGANYLVPVDAKVQSEGDVKYEAVNAGRVLSKMEDMGSRVNIVILDACRDNPFARMFRSSAKGLARMDAPAGSLIAYSTSPGSVAVDGQGRNGLYTKHLLKYIQESGLPVSEVFMRTRVDVANETGRKQIPWESTSLMGNFYFTRQGGVQAPPSSASGKKPVDFQLLSSASSSGKRPRPAAEAVREDLQVFPPETQRITLDDLQERNFDTSSFAIKLENVKDRSDVTINGKEVADAYYNSNRRRKTGDGSGFTEWVDITDLLQSGKNEITIAGRLNRFRGYSAFSLSSYHLTFKLRAGDDVCYSLIVPKTPKSQAKSRVFLEKTIVLEK